MAVRAATGELVGRVPAAVTGVPAARHAQGKDAPTEAVEATAEPGAPELPGPPGVAVPQAVAVATADCSAGAGVPEVAVVAAETVGTAPPAVTVATAEPEATRSRCPENTGTRARADRRVTAGSAAAVVPVVRAEPAALGATAGWAAPTGQRVRKAEAAVAANRVLVAMTARLARTVT
jgi:hypothetical protein